MVVENDFPETWNGLEDQETSEQTEAPLNSPENEQGVVCLYPNQWVSLYSKEGYVFSHETRCQGRIISVLPFKKVDLGNGYSDIQFLTRFEYTPAWTTIKGDRKISSLTGGVEKGEDPVLSAIRELQEEAGIYATYSDMISLGTCRGTKSVDTIYHLFTIDITEMGYLLHGEGDGSIAEAEAENLLLTSDALYQRADDPLLGLLLGRWMVYYKKEYEKEGRSLFL